MSETIKNEMVFPKVVNGVSYGEKFVDFDGLDYFWGKAKHYVDTADGLLNGEISKVSSDLADLTAIVNSMNGTEGTGSIADRINLAIESAIAGLKLDETYEAKGEAAKAEAAAKSYADGVAAAAKSGAETTAKGYADAAEAAAKSYTDDEIGKLSFDAAGTAKELSDAALVAAKEYADGLDEAMDARMQAVEGGVADVDNKITAAFNDFSTKVSDDKVVNTYKELIDYAAEHGAEFTELVGVVNSKADKTYVDGLDEAMDVRVKALEDHKDDYVAADETLASTLRGEIATAKGEAVSSANGYTDGKVATINGTIETLTGTVASNLTEAKSYADGVAAAAEAAAKADTVEKLKSYTTTTDMEAAIAAAKAAAIADAQGKIDSLTAVVNGKADKTYVDDQDAATLAAAKAYASTYTDQLFNSIEFVTDADIDGIFA